MIYLEKQDILHHVQEISGYLEKKLDGLVDKYEFLSERRGKGLMQGLEVAGRPVGEIVSKALENGLIVISAGNHVLRFVPPLIIQKSDVDEMAARLERVLKNL